MLNSYKFLKMVVFGHFHRENNAEEKKENLKIKKPYADVNFFFFFGKNATWNSSLVNSSSMQHNTRTYHTRVLCKYKTRAYCSFLFFFYGTRVPCNMELEFLILFFFSDNQQININIKISNFFSFERTSICFYLFK